MRVLKYARTSGSVVKTNAPLEVVHSDLMGPIDVTSKGWARYIFVFIDDWSRYVLVYLFKRKSEVLEKFKEYKAFMESQLDTRIRCIRSDNGGEYCSKQFYKLCVNHGI